VRRLLGLLDLLLRRLLRGVDELRVLRRLGPAAGLPRSVEGVPHSLEELRITTQIICGGPGVLGQQARGLNLGLSDKAWHQNVLRSDAQNHLTADPCAALAPGAGLCDATMPAVTEVS